jgi:alpha-1,2-mannosyltransferase
MNRLNRFATNKWIGLVITLVTFGVIAWIIVIGQERMVDRDWFTYWAGGRGLLENANLYQRQEWLALHQSHGSTWFPNPIFIYAPPTAIFFAPLAALPVDLAATIWVWASQVMIVISICLIALDMKWNFTLQSGFWWAIGVLIFLPGILTLVMGQASALILLVLTVTAVLWDRNHWFAGGLGLGLTMIKPQAVVLVVLGLGVWLVVKKRWDALGGMIMAFGAGVLATFLLFPNFIFDWLSSATSKVGGVGDRMPTLWGTMADVFGVSPLTISCALLLTVVLVLATLGLTIRWREQKALVVTSMLVLPSLVVTPYLWNYDQILVLVPLFTALIMLSRRGISRRILVWFPLLASVFEWMLFAVSAVRLRDTLGITLPIGVGLVLWYAVRNSPLPSRVEKG